MVFAGSEGRWKYDCGLELPSPNKPEFVADVRGLACSSLFWVVKVVG